MFLRILLRSRSLGESMTMPGLSVEYLAAAGVLDRCELIGGNFLQSVPKDGDAYIMKRILMDWDDEDCVKMLRLCRDAMTGNGRVLTVNVVLPPANQPHPGKVIDIFLMI
jgi:hypothetical protein